MSTCHKTSVESRFHVVKINNATIYSEVFVCSQWSVFLCLASREKCHQFYWWDCLFLRQIKPTVIKSNAIQYIISIVFILHTMWLDNKHTIKLTETEIHWNGNRSKRLWIWYDGHFFKISQAQFINPNLNNITHEIIHLCSSDTICIIAFFCMLLSTWRIIHGCK